MYDENSSAFRGYGNLPNTFGHPAEVLWNAFALNPYGPVQRSAAFRLAAIGRDAPIKDAPVTLPNPFDFSQSVLGDLQNRFLWNKLMFDSRPLPMNPFFSSDSNLTPRSNLFDQAPMNPLEGVPILPPQFR